ncbi:flavoprotein [Desulfogranum marinum]|uniref:flavoprotein n=1 Tax=Desulfogranum marinum TaxID=453220 RepID=UPI0029C6524B|nr:flavoprotein [Desulfogranum marinum]
MENDFINKLVIEVVSRLAQKMGADGSRQTILAVCTGCNGNVERAVDQLRHMVMKGFKLNLFFSANAGNTYRNTVENQLKGLPYVQTVNPGQWGQCHDEFNKAEGVVVPIASINTLSKLSMLMADTPHEHLLLNAVTIGKPLIIAGDGGLFGSRIRKPLVDALGVRLASIQEYGAVVCEMRALAITLESCFDNQQNVDTQQTILPEQVLSGPPVPNNPALSDRRSSGKPKKHLKGRVVTASHINFAVQNGYDLVCADGVIVTPMAKDMAAQKGVKIEQV